MKLRSVFLGVFTGVVTVAVGIFAAGTNTVVTTPPDAASHTHTLSLSATLSTPVFGVVFPGLRPQTPPPALWLAVSCSLWVSS